MRDIYKWSLVEAQVADTIAIWDSCAVQTSAMQTPGSGPRYTAAEQHFRERAYDDALVAVEQEAKRIPPTLSGRLERQQRITASFAQFSARALDLRDEATQILTHDFLPVGTALARWARRFDPSLSMPDIIQACRNAWTACGLQPLLGEPMQITPAILAYSLLYPYSDNYLDLEHESSAAKLRFSERFRDRLRGETLTPHNSREASVWIMVELIEGQFPRCDFPEVFDCLLAIHRAQQESLAQVSTGNLYDDAELLRLSCAKGGTSVLADACLARGRLTAQETQFAFEWGVLLQLGDDLQDIREDLARGSVTLFSRSAAAGQPLDGLVTQLLNFADRVGARMDHLPNGTATLRDLLRMSWRSLIVGAVANSHEFFSPEFLKEAERSSPFRFGFLRARRERLTSRQGLYATLFDAFLEGPDETLGNLPSPESYKALHTDADFETIGEVSTL